MEAQDDRIISSLIDSFNKVSSMLGGDLDSVMALTAIEILSMKDVPSIIDKTFFDRGWLLLTDCEGLMVDNIKACMFWWVFNGEKMEKEVELLTKCG